MPDVSDTPPSVFERTATGVRVVHAPVVVKTEEEEKAERAQRYPLTPKLQAKLEAEMAAGKKRIEYAEEQRRLNPPQPPTEKELIATGKSTPVFRPDQFVEYAKNFKNKNPTRSKDM